MFVERKIVQWFFWRLALATAAIRITNEAEVILIAFSIPSEYNKGDVTFNIKFYIVDETKQ